MCSLLRRNPDPLRSPTINVYIYVQPAQTFCSPERRHENETSGPKYRDSRVYSHALRVPGEVKVRRAHLDTLQPRIASSETRDQRAVRDVVWLKASSKENTVDGLCLRCRRCPPSVASTKRRVCNRRIRLQMHIFQNLPDGQPLPPVAHLCILRDEFGQQRKVKSDRCGGQRELDRLC
jgi:hypothetical protein